MVLLQQIEERRDRILKDRRKELDLERQNEVVQNQMEMEALVRENAQRQVRLDRLTELEQIATAQWDRAEEKVRILTQELEDRSQGVTSNTDENLENVSKERIESVANNNLDAMEISTEEGRRDDNSNDLLSGSESTTHIKDSEGIQQQILDSINCNTMDLQTTTDATRNRNHMKASSIVLGDLYVNTRNQKKTAIGESPSTPDENSNRILAVDQETPADTVGVSEEEISITVDIPTIDSNQKDNIGDLGRTTDQSSSPSPVAQKVERDPNLRESGNFRKSHTSPNKCRMRASLSLDLKAPEDKDLKFHNTPMSTTSDILTDSFEPDPSDVNTSKNSSDEYASAEGSPMSMKLRGAISVKPPTKPKPNRFAIRELSAKYPSLATCMPSIPITPVEEKKTIAEKANPAYTYAELRDINVTNLSNFLQQSFAIPLRAHFSILNNEILKIFLSDLTIFSHFNSLRNYFLMMDSEFANNIFTGLVEKLETVSSPSELLNSSVLHSILGNALHSNVAALDKNADNLSFALTNVPKEWNRESPDVFDPIMLVYQVDWPLNLVLSAEMIDHYGAIFQFLVKLRRISWLLEQVFFVSLCSFYSFLL